MAKITVSRELVLMLLESEEDFPIDLDDAFPWIGYSKKQDAKEVLTNNFVEGQDFLRKGVKNPSIGRPSEWILLTIDCFKSLSMMAGTEKGREVRQYFLGCEAELKKRIKDQGERQTLGAYTRRVSLGFKMEEPSGHFTVFHKSSHLLIYVEIELKLPIDTFDLLDGSVGQRWAKYRKEKEWAGSRIPYDHIFPDKRDVQSAWAYPVSELQYFDEWLRTVYIPEHLPVYLKGKYGAMVKVDSASSSVAAS
jgi:phage anti-repressor protein